EQRQTGLGLDPELGGPGEGILGALEIAQATANLADIAEPERGVEEVDARQLGARLTGFLLGLLPFPAQLEDLCSVDPAETGEGAERMGCRPHRADVRPLRGAPEIAQLLTGADQAAVHLPGGEGAEAPL